MIDRDWRPGNPTYDDLAQERRNKEPTSLQTEISWDDRDPESGLHDRNGHRIHLSECEWICLKCRCKFDAAVDAEKDYCKFSEREI